MCTQSFEGYRDWDKKKTLNPMGLGMKMEIINGDGNEGGNLKILLKSDPLSSSKEWRNKNDKQDYKKLKLEYKQLYWLVS